MNVSKNAPRVQAEGATRSEGIEHMHLQTSECRQCRRTGRRILRGSSGSPAPWGSSIEAANEMATLLARFAVVNAEAPHSVSYAFLVADRLARFQAARDVRAMAVTR